MSDSVKKYFEDNKLTLLCPEEKRQLDELELIALAVKANKITQVTERAASVQLEYKGASLLVALQIACDENDLLQN
jgi:hypothetical protein|tara:strand:- start:305 stop:532 length:228 start_codon:yes stop_codon:yes gene_type:complete